MLPKKLIVMSKDDTHGPKLPLWSYDEKTRALDREMAAACTVPIDWQISNLIRMANERGDVIREVWLDPCEVEELRHLMRFRGRLSGDTDYDAYVGTFLGVNILRRTHIE